MKLETIIEGLQDVIKEAKSFADKPEVRRGAEYLVPIFGIFPFYNDVFKEKIAATADELQLIPAYNAYQLFVGGYVAYKSYKTFDYVLQFIENF